MTLCVLAAAVLALAADWPQWRGPNRDGLSPEKGLLQEWPPGGPPLLWKAEGLGRGFASVAIVGGRIFTLGDREDGEYLMALDLATRKELWATKVGRPYGDGSHGTPCVDGGLVFGITPHGDLACCEAAAGRLVWRKNFEQDFGGRMMSQYGYSESPLVDGDRLVCTPGGKEAMIVAINKRTGEVLWKCPEPDLSPKGLDGAGYASMVVAEAGGIRLYVQFVGRGLVGVAAEDGRLLWGYNRIAGQSANVGTPIASGDRVFASASYGGGAALLKVAPTGDGGVKAEEVYHLDAETFQIHHGEMVLVDGYLYGTPGFFLCRPACLELATGKVMWKAEEVARRGSASVIYADGRLYFRHESNVMSLVEATPAGYHETGSFRIPGGNARGWARPVLCDGKLYLRDQDVLFCYDVQKH